MTGHDSNRLTGAAVIRRVLQKYGVTAVFALAGASQSRLLAECEDNGLFILPSRHETATVGAADGYARVARRIGVACINVDQGMPNAVSGIQSAFEAGSPVLILIGREPDDWTEPELPVDHDALALVRPITKWARTVRSADRLGEYVDAACRHALSGRPGPVALAYPKDFLAAEIDPAADLDGPPSIPSPPVPDPAAIEKAAGLIAAAERPLIIAGSGTYWAQAAEPLRHLANEFGIPVFSHAMGRGVVAETAGPDRLGWSWGLAQDAAKHADCILWAGCRMGKRFLYGLEPRFAADAAMIQIDVEPSELGRNRPVQVAIQADAGRALIARHDALQTAGAKRRDPRWVGAALEEKLAAIAADRAPEGSIHPYALGEALNRLLLPDALIVQDGAFILARMFAVLRRERPYRYIDTHPLGSMGMGTPLALGAAAAPDPPSPIVLITGDGSFGFYAAEVDSAVQAGLPLLVVIANNGGWGNELAMQPPAIGRTVNAGFGRAVRYDLVARGFGAEGERVDDPVLLESRLSVALHRVQDEGKVVVLDIVTPEPPFDPAQGTIRYGDVAQTRRAHFGDR